jgi:putative endonuclease
MAGLDRRAFGAEGEEAAVRLLEEAGFRVRDRNWTCRFGELDIVAEREDLVCFVEVRMRSHAAWGDPAHTISFGKQRKVVKAALHYLFTHHLADRMIRFDVVTVVGRGLAARVEHLPAAFDAGM